MGYTAAAAVLAFAVPFVLSILLTMLTLKVSLRIGFLDKPGGHKSHEKPTPLGGGAAMFVAWSAPVGVALAIACLAPQASFLPRVIRAEFAKLADRANPISLLLLGGLVVMLLGLWDDARSLSVRVRTVVHLALASGLYLASHELRITLFSGWFGWSWLSFAYTVLWIFGITNAFNFLDNTDGLSAGVAMVASIILSVVGIQTDQMLMAWLSLALAGTAAGLLLFNFPPARIFMGDAGGLFLGFVLSVLTILFTFYRTGPAASGRLYGVLMPIFILALPIFDTLTVVVIRLREGRPIWRGDRNHFSHRLLAMGMSKREAVLFIYLVTFCLGLASTLLDILDTARAVIILVIGVTIFTLIALLERAGRRKT